MITISSGHAKYVSGANDIVSEVAEARKITNRIAALLVNSMKANVFHDDTSRDQKTNINTIVAAHNKTDRRADYSVHLNASSGRVQGGMGVEVLYYSDEDKAHAQAICDAVTAATGLKNRGAKKRTDLGFTRNRNKSGKGTFLIEAYFVNSVADVALMDNDAKVTKFCEAVAKTICAYVGVTYKTNGGGTMSNQPRAAHEADWNWAKEQGFLDGTQPQAALTREQFASVIHRVYKKLEEKETKSE